MNDEISKNQQTLPNALRVWDNRARRSLPPGLFVWLTFLVLTCLTSAFFVRDHVPARWVLGGFIASHLLVILLANLKNFTMRVGVVSISHVVCWPPGLFAVIADIDGRRL